MKATVENLGPTRVKLRVEVPFEGLRPSFDAAYRRLASQVKVKGFRPGKVPPQILEQRIGRAAVLEEVVTDAVPHFYTEAVRQLELRVAGRPEVELESFGEDQPLTFSATVDVRPPIDLPAYEGLPIAVDEVTLSDEDVDRQVETLRDRFAVLTAVDRPAQVGDFVLLDLRAAKDGEAIPGSEATGLSYEVGSGGLVPGLDRAVLGAAAGEPRHFDAEIAYGELAGTLATFDVTVTAVREKQVPALDDDFARSASEFDTLAELRAEIGGRITRLRQLEQAVQARDRVLDALVGQVDVPLPQAMLDEEYAWRRERLEKELTEAGSTFERFLAEAGRTQPEVEEELRRSAAQSVKAQLVLDAVAVREDLSVTEAELTDQVVRRAARSGVRAEEFADQLVRSGELPDLMGEILRGKALAAVLETAKVVDTAGRPVDLGALRDDATPAGAEA